MAGQKNRVWRLGADLGANSLGWAAIELTAARGGEPISILAAGSRIFSDGRDPKSGASLAVDRRDARAMRRRRDRFKQRQRALIRHLTTDGLFPADEDARKAMAAIDPYAVRARALSEPLSLPELARALFHLNQRRGFKSNRKTDRKAQEDAGKIATGIDRTRTAIRLAEEEAGAEPESWTYGKWLYERRLQQKPVRTRLRPEPGENAKGDGYDFYPGRALMEEEFEAIWEAQARHHPDVLTDAVHGRLREIIFYQRPLKAPQIGMCTLIAGEKRLAKAHPLFQRRRLLEELNALMIVRPGQVAQRLTRDERDKLFLQLKGKAKMSFASLRKLLNLDPDARFNKESENRTELKGDEVAAAMGAKARFGNRWSHLSVEEQWEVIERLEAVESDADDAAFCAWLANTYNLTEDQARAVIHAPLPTGYGRFGEQATRRLIDALRDGDKDGRVLVYSEAVVEAGFGHHSDLRTGEVFEDAAGRPQLPYYGVALERHIMPGTGDPKDPDEVRIGRLTNPTVHIGLNQLRRVVNALIRAYGPPAEIAIELARELKLTDDDKKRIARENNENRLAAEGRSKKLLEIGQQDNGANRARLKLWEELNSGNVLDRRCVYTGQQISIDMLFSPAVEVDHILPFTATLDDSNGNKILCLREANREKRQRSPYEAWGHTDRWDDIAARATRLPRNKRWRFEPDAMEKFREEGGFQARHLVDTQYLARLAREYLATLYPDKGEGSGRIWVSPGRLTEMVRRKLGLNDLLPDHNFAGGADQPKNRLDHRHHAIDAVVVAIVDRSMLNAIARASGQEGTDGRERIEIPPPWKTFRDDLRTAVNAIVVSHRTDHGTTSKTGLPQGADATAGRLHNDTAYGFTGETDAKGNSIVVRRALLSSFRKLADIDRIRDVDLKAALQRHLEGLEGKAFEKALLEFPDGEWHPFRGLRRVRVVEPLTVIPIRDRHGRAYKGYKGDSNYRFDVWELPDGKWVTSWKNAEGTTVSSIISMFDAHQPAAQPRPHPAARKVLSVQQNDLLAIEQAGEERKLMRVVKFGQNGQITLAEHQQAGDLKKRDATPNEDDPFKYFAPTAGGLKKVKARQVRIDEIGRYPIPAFPPARAGRPPDIVERIVDIATDGRHLSAYRGFLIVSEDRREVGRVPLDDVAAVIVHAHGVTWSTNLVVALAQRGAVMLLCGSNHAPVALCLPLEGHHAQNSRMRAQWAAGKPLSKQLWRRIVVAKIRWQAAVLDANGISATAFDLLARRVGSGDPDNVEAQAARRYWPLLMGDGFRRDRNADDINALLNYGYTILRSLCARAVVASGLHPSIGVHHANRTNAFALADDLIEPFRPLVDALALRLKARGIDQVTPDAKHAFAGLIALDLPGADGTTTLAGAANRAAQTLARAFESGQAADIILPLPPSALELAGLDSLLA